MNLLLLQYNNYFNRIVKKEDSIADYIVASPNYKQFTGVDFDPKNNVSSSQAINWAENFTPNYLVCYETNESTDTIVSRWFITNWSRIRGKQYEAELKRDAIADNYDIVLDSPCYIEKGTVKSVDDPAVYNTEDMALNQIKTDEMLLNDPTACPWIVGYIAKDATISTPAPIDIDPAHIETQAIASDITNWKFYKFREGSVGQNFHTPITNSELTFKYYLTAPLAYVGYDLTIKQGYDSHNNIYTTASNIRSYEWASSFFHWEDGYKTLAVKINDNITNIVNQFNITLDSESSSDLSELKAFNNKYIKDTNNKIYHIEVIKTGYTKSVFRPNEAAETLINSCITQASLTGTINNVNSSFTAYRDNYRVRITEEPTLATTITIPDTRYHCDDALYDMFAMPYGNINVTVGSLGFVSNKRVQMAAANALVTALGGAGANSKIYDVQLLPYCPIPDITSTNAIIVDDRIENYQYSLIKQSSTSIGIVLYPKQSNITINIAKNLDVEEYDSSDVINYKLDNECKMYRLCSPNYSGSFDFSVAKNKGVKYFNVDCTFKPYNPYIHVNPLFNGLYGRDFNDARGLTCNGDFSFGILTDKFVEYELNNKNYENIFNRQIQNLDMTNKYSRLREQVNAVSNIFTQGAKGAEKGLTLSGGNPAGALVGAAVGTVASTASAIADISISDKMRAENRSYIIDKYNYSLQNVQALPLSLSKCSMLTYNNKLFPFVEIYDCTDIEKQAFINKIRYNGMSILRIDNIRNFLSTDKRFIKGDLIRLENLNDDPVIANDIYNEILKGVYL